MTGTFTRAQNEVLHPMADTDVDAQGNPIVPAAGTPTGSPEQAGLEGLDELTLARRRQAGADARANEERKLREAAEAEAANLRAQLAGSSKPKDPAEQPDIARIQADAEAKANAKYLNRVFPKARERFPEVTDEARLAELEALYAQPAEEDGPPTPRGVNGIRRPGGNPAERTSKDMFNDLKKGGLPFDMPDITG